MYKALYTKWRPVSFNDVISQPHITTTLKNQAAAGKTAHAYLFTGSRGTGKTTCARILAKAVNCENSSDGNPCGVCDICKDADKFALGDITEIDAASNNGVDDIRSLRESAVYMPERCKYRVYIIDEVHMLSTGAFNALLKIMEEPPPHIKFILATTDVHKVPATILSRCQRYDFRRILAKDIAERLIFIAEKENMQLDASAADMIARLSDGGMRDALSLLDRCCAYSENITSETVTMAAGISDRRSIFEMIEAVQQKDTAKAIAIIDRLYALSKDMTDFCNELLSVFRDIMLIKTAPSAENTLSCLPDEMGLVRELADNCDSGGIFDNINALQSCLDKLPKALNKRTEFEITAIAMCSGKLLKTTKGNSEAESICVSEPSADMSILLKKISELENTIQKLSENKISASDTSKGKIMPPPENIQTASPPPNNEDFKKAVKFELWDNVLEEIQRVSPPFYASLKNSEAVINQEKNIVYITARLELFKTLYAVPGNKALILRLIKNATGKDCKTFVKCSPEANAENNDVVNKLIEKAAKNGVSIDIRS